MIKSQSAENFGTISRWETPQLSEKPVDSAPTQEELDQLRQTAFDQGYNDGYKAGLDQAEAEMKEQFEKLAQLLDSVCKPLADLDQQALEYLVQLSGKIARTLVKRELKTDPETIMALVRDTAAVLASSVNKIRIHLHPDDAQIIYSLTQSATEKNRWEIVEDPLVAHGDCKASSLNSIVVGDIQTRINAIITDALGDDRA